VEELMASGKTEEMINFSRQMGWRRPTPKPKKARDRTLNGKARIRARREAAKKMKAIRIAALQDHKGARESIIHNKGRGA
jgi:thymidine kinase